MKYALKMTGRQHAVLRRHLYPGDGLEAVAVALCGRRAGAGRQVLSVHDMVLIPHDECIREPDLLHWKTDRLVPFLERVAGENLALVKFHSHPGGYTKFSAPDTDSDLRLFESVFGWSSTDAPHASAIMLPDGSLFGRAALPGGRFQPLDAVAVAGDELLFWFCAVSNSVGLEEFRRHEQVFGSGTIQRLRRLSIAVVGCSGTGSHVVELLGRLGVGRLVLVDPDHVERRNLNRILNATAADAAAKRLKVDVLRDAVLRMGLGTAVEAVPENLLDREAALAVAECDVVFGCMDSAEGRHVLNRLAAFYSLPYFDLCVRIDADGDGGVTSAGGTVHYLQPDGASLLARGAYKMEQVEAEGLRRTNPAEYAARKREKYIVGIDEDRPAVVSLNGQVANTAVNEFLARLHPYRRVRNSEYATVRLDLMESEMFGQSEPAPSRDLARHVGRADCDPLLGMPILSQPVVRIT
jgi:hypothetical protein